MARDYTFTQSAQFQRVDRKEKKKSQKMSEHLFLTNVTTCQNFILRCA